MRLVLFLIALLINHSAIARDIGVDDLANLRKEKANNQLRFKKQISGTRFIADAAFENIIKSPTFLIPGYFISFKQKGVEITCVSNNTKTLNLIESLNKGDIVHIEAMVEDDPLTQYDDGFSLYNCKISKK